MRYLIALALILSGCAAPDYYTRLEDPKAANDCVAKLLDQTPMTIMPIFFVEPAPWSINYRGERVKVYGTFRRGVIPRLDMILVADGSNMAESVIHEFGHRYGLYERDAEALIRRMGECGNSN